MGYRRQNPSAGTPRSAAEVQAVRRPWIFAFAVFLSCGSRCLLLTAGLRCGGWAGLATIAQHLHCAAHVDDNFRGVTLNALCVCPFAGL